MAPPRAGNGDLLKVGSLNQHVNGPGIDLSGGPAHDTGNPNSTAFIGDQQIFSVEFADFAVEGFQRLAGYRATHHNLTGDLIGVVEVQRLAQLQHDVVGNVHGQRDGADAGETQT